MSRASAITDRALLVLLSFARPASCPCDGVGAVRRLGQRERADRVEPDHGRQPALLLLRGAEERDRLHGQARLHAEEPAEAAVAAVQLHVDQAAGERAHAGAAVVLDVLAVEAELGEPAHQRPGELGGLPVLVDRGQHLAVHAKLRTLVK
jgi:hypothetical protein